MPGRPQHLTIALGMGADQRLDQGGVRPHGGGASKEVWDHIFGTSTGSSSPSTNGRV